MTTPTLSILIPSVPVRRTAAEALQTKLIAQADAAGVDAEILCLSDNFRRSIGLKRQALLDIARGDYVAYCDDDDDVTDTYMAALAAAASRGQDVITFEQHATWNGHRSTVEFRLGAEDREFAPGGRTLRGPWHSCAWRRRLVTNCQFPDKNWGEDYDWVRQARRCVRSESHVRAVLHIYCHSDATSLAMADRSGRASSPAMAG